jgi:hypothetical protein
VTINISPAATAKPNSKGSSSGKSTTAAHKKKVKTAAKAPRASPAKHRVLVSHAKPKGSPSGHPSHAPSRPARKPAAHPAAHKPKKPAKRR